MTTTAQEKLMAKATRAAEAAIGKTITIQKRKAELGISGIIITGTIKACLVHKLRRRTSSGIAVFKVYVRDAWYIVEKLPTR